MEPDPIGQWGGVNVYLYAMNRPIMVIDPLGLLSLEELECLLEKLAKFFGFPYMVVGPFPGLLKGGAMMGAGTLMVAVGGGTIVGGGIMTAGGTVSGGTGALAGIPTMAAGAAIVGTGGAVAAGGYVYSAEAVKEAIELFAEECGCDPDDECCGE